MTCKLAGNFSLVVLNKKAIYAILQYLFDIRALRFDAELHFYGGYQEALWQLKVISRSPMA